MGKPTTAALLNGALLALGNLASPTAAKADYTVYYPANAGFQVQHAAYQTSRDQGNGGQGYSLPPEIRPYEPQMENPAYYQPQPTHIPSGWPPRQASYAPAPQPARTQAATSAYVTPERRALLDAAYRTLGISYRWGGNTPREGFDCSGLTKFTHKNAKVNIPRTALEQSRASRTISRSDLRPGDMIFFKTSGSTVNHVGIYVGNGKFIHAASGGGHVTLDDLRKSYWQKRLVKYGTFLS